MSGGSQHMFNELQRTNTVTADNGIPNGNVNSGSGSGSGGAVNGVTATATTTTATAAIATIGPTASGSALRINSNDPGDLTNINKNNDIGIRKKTKSKQQSLTSSSLANMNQHHSSASTNRPTNTSNSKSSYSKRLEEWLNSNNNNINVSNSNNNGDSSNVGQKSLDEWLQTTLKDSPSNAYSQSSMEFLDAARSGAISGLPNFGSSYKIGPEFQNPHSFESNYDSSPYFPVGNFPNLKIPNHTTDFTSLPPAMHLNHEANRNNSQNDLLDGLENRRFSDPCLAGNSDEETDQPAPTNDKLNPKNQSDNNKLLTTLLQQINNLHETNSKIIRNINDQKGMYTPGMMTDVVREVKEAARVREEALLSRVRSMVEERSWTMNESHLKLIRDMEEMKMQMNQLKQDKIDTNKHISKMEDEMKSLRTLLAQALNYCRSNTVIAQTNPIGSERNFLRQQSNSSSMRSPSDRQKRHSLSLNYGTISQEENLMGSTSMLYHNENDILQPMQDQFSELLRGEKLKYTANGNGNGSDSHNYHFNHNGNFTNSDDGLNEGQLVQMEKDNLELRRELQDALATKKQADGRIQALEHLVKSLQRGGQPPSHGNGPELNSIVTVTHSALRNAAHSECSPSIKPQLATQIQMTSPKLLSNNNNNTNSSNNNTSTINLTGPVTDL